MAQGPTHNIYFLLVTWWFQHVSTLVDFHHKNRGGFLVEEHILSNGLEAPTSIYIYTYLSEGPKIRMHQRRLSLDGRLWVEQLA